MVQLTLCHKRPLLAEGARWKRKNERAKQTWAPRNLHDLNPVRRLPSQQGSSQVPRDVSGQRGYLPELLQRTLVLLPFSSLPSTGVYIACFIWDDLLLLSLVVTCSASRPGAAEALSCRLIRASRCSLSVPDAANFYSGFKFDCIRKTGVPG